MKKLLAILLALAMVLSLAACGNNDTPDNPGTPDSPDGTVGDSTVGDGTADDNNTVEPDTADDEDMNPITSAVSAINRIWDEMPEDFKPMAFGGDYNEANQVENAAGVHDIGDGTELDSNFGYPAGMIDKISEAAALRHMMNVNSFSCGAYGLKDPADAQAVADGIRDALMNRSYLCGAPQWLVVMSLPNGFVVNAFGADDIINAFKEAAIAAYGDNVTILIDETMEGAHGNNGIALGDFGIALG